MNIDLDKLEALARAATPGPWIPHSATESLHAVRTANGRIVADVGYSGRLDRDSENAEYIAAVNPAAVLELIALARAGQQAGEAAGLSVAHRELSDRLGREAAENLSLKTENRALHAKLCREWENLEVANKRVDELQMEAVDLRAQLARAQRDAERIDWMAGSDFVSLNQYLTAYGKDGSPLDGWRLYFQVVIEHDGAKEFQADSIREAIDTARAQLTNPIGK